jgi:hypothetical protein
MSSFGYTAVNGKVQLISRNKSHSPFVSSVESEASNTLVTPDRLEGKEEVKVVCREPHVMG